MTDRIVISDEEGNPLGTARPVADHQLLVFGWEEMRPAGKILCPESGLGGCEIASGERTGCWVDDWFGNLAGEMVEATNLELIFDIEPVGAGEEFSIRMTELVDAQKGPK